jgi:hypothetical protein
VREVIDWQKNIELASVDETRQSFHSALNNLVDGALDHWQIRTEILMILR